MLRRLMTCVDARLYSCVLACVRACMHVSMLASTLQVGGETEAKGSAPDQFFFSVSVRVRVVREGEAKLRACERD